MVKKDVLRNLFLKHVKVDIDEVPMSTPIKELDIDSLDLMEILMDVEDETGIVFTNEELQSIKTLNDLMNILATKG